MNTDRQQKNRILQLLTYLIEIGKLKSKTVYDVQEYRQLLWFHQLPQKSKHCKSSAWGSALTGQAEWLSVQRSDYPTVPPVPEVCLNWVDCASVEQADQAPVIRRAINFHDLPQYSNLSSTYKTLCLTDFPEVSQVWQTYLDEEWRPWADAVQNWHQEEEAYKALFDIYHEHIRLGDEHELVLGLGLLQCQPENRPLIRRHLLTINVQLDFDLDACLFRLEPSNDDWHVDMETNMLDVANQPEVLQRIEVERMLADLDSPWQSKTLQEGLEKLFSAPGEDSNASFHFDRLEPSEGIVGSTAVIDFAPALLLRKRSNHSQEDTLRKLCRSVETCDVEQLPAEFLDLCELNPDKANFQTLPLLIDHDNAYLPKPYNNEQISILKKLNESHGVRVQGPPGTGKTHTIANLVSHLLSMGQRVLVTAKSPRSLAVLHRQLPEAIQPLCINALGDREDDQTSLEDSVLAILQNHEQWVEDTEQGEISTLKVSIQDQIINRSVVDRRIQAIRDAEIRHHEIANGRYCGSAATIARRLATEASSHGWIVDDIFEQSPLVVPSHELKAIVETLAGYSEQERETLNQVLPVPFEDLPSEVEFTEIVETYTSAKERYESRKDHLDSEIGQTLVHSDLRQVKHLARTVSELYKGIREATRVPLPWVKQAANEVLSGNERPWRELFDATAIHLDILMDRAAVVDTQSITKPDSVTYNQLLLDALELTRHVAEGGRLSKSMVSSQPLRGRRYVVEKVRINGELCSTSENIEALIEYLSVQKQLAYLWKLWGGISGKNNTSLVLQVAELRDHQQALERILKLTDLVNQTQKAFDVIPDSPQINCRRLAQIEALYVSCRAFRSKLRYGDAQAAYQSVVAQVEIFADQPYRHPAVADVRDAVAEGNVTEYALLLQKIVRLRERADALEHAEERLSELAKSAPKLAEAFSSNPADTRWPGRLNQIDDAWAFAQARTWLAGFTNNEDLRSCERECKNIDDKITRSLEQLGAKLAWSELIQTLESDDNEAKKHLVGWQQAIARCDNGSDTCLPKNRRDVQYHLQKCRTAVPAWIMPLHKVYDEIEPLPGMFDVVIVDESSQCGLEALPLLLMGKRLLVVGDDQQISPDPVSIPQDDVAVLIDRHLSDFEYSASFGLDNSLFDHAKLRFNKAVVLREHFRSMPEIIGFSNQLCYEKAPLIPLRRGYLDRLLPLQSVYIANAKQEKSGDEFINLVEAEQLVEAVVRCFNDAKYDGKTFGVIALQGYAQAQLIGSMLLKTLGEQAIEQRNLLCGTPSDFQGDERHVIFLSMVVAETQGQPLAALTASEHIQRFNVAASRAQDQMWLFHSVKKTDLDSECVRYTLLNYFDHPDELYGESMIPNDSELTILVNQAQRAIETAPYPFANWFEVDIYLALHQKGYGLLPKFPVATSVIDIVVESGGGQLGVVCDSDSVPVDAYRSVNVIKQRMLERCGWQFFRLLESAYYADPERSLAELSEALTHAGIEPTVPAVEHLPQADKTTVEPKDDSIEKDISVANESVTVELPPAFEESIEVPEEQSERGVSQHLVDVLVTPENVADMLALADEQMSLLVIKTLQARPKNSCLKELLPTLMLKQVNIRMQGADRNAFIQRVNGVLPQMERSKIIEMTASGGGRINLVE